jgi:hypothetical protein
VEFDLVTRILLNVIIVLSIIGIKGVVEEIVVIVLLYKSICWVGCLLNSFSNSSEIQSMFKEIFEIINLLERKSISSSLSKINLIS